MSTFKHECVVVSGDLDVIIRAHNAATEIYNASSVGSLVSPIQQHLSNGGASFWIIPDGSKEGWVISDSADKARKEFIEYLHENSMTDWAHVELGGDEGKYRVVDGPLKGEM